MQCATDCKDVPYSPRVETFVNLWAVTITLHHYSTSDNHPVFIYNGSKLASHYNLHCY